MVLYRLQRNISWSLFISNTSVARNRIRKGCPSISTYPFLRFLDSWEIVNSYFQFFTLIDGCSLCTFENCFQYWLPWLLMLLLRYDDGISTTGFFLNLGKSIFNRSYRIHLTTIISLHLFIACDIGRLSNLVAAFSSKIKRICIIIIWTFFFLLLSFIQGS
jgi:hypothetical protein